MAATAATGWAVQGPRAEVPEVALPGGRRARGDPRRQLLQVLLDAVAEEVRLIPTKMRYANLTARSFVSGNSGAPPWPVPNLRAMHSIRLSNRRVQACLGGVLVEAGLDSFARCTRRVGQVIQGFPSLTLVCIEEEESP